jgi:hypothetical protein
MNNVNDDFAVILEYVEDRCVCEGGGICGACRVVDAVGSIQKQAQAQEQALARLVQTGRFLSQLAEAQAELDKLIGYARYAAGDPEVASVYEVLDMVPKLRNELAEAKGRDPEVAGLRGLDS